MGRVLSFFTGVMMMAAHAVADEAPTLLTDPLLLDPGTNSVSVVWFTEFEGANHRVEVGKDQTPRVVAASTSKLSRTAEDGRSHIEGQAGEGEVLQETTPRDIYRHEALVDGLESGTAETYRVISEDTSGNPVESDYFTLASLPPAGAPLKILLTSDHQSKAMTPANLQKVVDTIGQVDAVFFAGDLVNIPDRASEWFDDARGKAFFPSLQGRADSTLKIANGGTHTFQGGAIIQNAPLYPVIGNHEVMGRYEPEKPIRDQFNSPRPRKVAEQEAEERGPWKDEAEKKAWIEDNSFNATTFNEIFAFPEFTNDKGYFFRRFGDVALVGLHLTRIWRSPKIDGETRGRYVEADADLGDPSAWGWGTFPFVTIERGSPQYQWLAEILQSDDFATAPYKVVMLHHPPRGFGGNSVPSFVEPEQIIEHDGEGNVTSVRYEYPIIKDMMIHDLEPLLIEHEVDLVLFGHSHIWQHIVHPEGMHYLETANVGNTYGCFLEGGPIRENHPDDPRFDAANYTKAGDAYGLPATPPSIFAPQNDEQGNPSPCVTSNNLTAFSILDTGKGTVDSYVYDVRNPETAVRMFDSFALKPDEG